MMRVTWLLLALGGVAACGRPTPPTSVTDLVFLTRDGCVQTDAMRARLDEALKAEGLPTNYQVIDLASLKADDRRTGYPTPTLLYADRDLFGMAPPTPPYPEPT